ncbi:MAG: hypothetical protein J7M21_05405, partial [Planctomycetes bacterium]|nr:hypothetical protein [Planctomycetota bacterium]
MSPITRRKVVRFLREHRGAVLIAAASTAVVVVAGVVCLLAAGPGGAGQARAGGPSRRERLSRGIDLAAAYLARSVGPRGRFVYAVNLDPAVLPRADYSIIHHAGAVYALADYARDKPDRPVVSALRRAVGFLRKSSIRGAAGRADVLAAWSLPETAGAGRAAEATL